MKKSTLKLHLGVTEQPEGVKAGTVKVIGTEVRAIVNQTSKLLQDAEAYNLIAQAVNPYGDGQAPKRIVDILARDVLI